MQITNNFADPVIVFLFGRGDLAWPLVVADPVLFANVALAEAEATLNPGRTTTINSATGDGYVGVKRGGLGRFGEYLSPPSLDIVSSSAIFEVTPAGQLLWVNRPVAPDPTPRLTTSELTNPLPHVTGYVVGVGKAEVTDPAAKDELSAVPMQGWAVSDQKSSGIESELYARAFIVADPATQQRIVMVVADIWSCSIALKEAVIERLQRGNAEVPYRTDNVFIAGTHTHSAHAGFLHHLLYNLAAGGFDPHVFECFVRGIVRAIELAHQDLSPGAVYVNEGDIVGLTRNRSLPAFSRNPSGDRAAFPNAVDERMTLLKFVRRKPQSTDEIAIGALTWFAIHPTNRGSNNLLINGDNKGAASAIFEGGAARLPGTRRGFVAAFGNSACGDVSGNFVQGSAPNTFEPPISDDHRDIRRYMARMQAAGKAQSDKAVALFTSATEELTGPLGTRHQRIDLPARAGASGALGISMAAGSSEDGGPMFIPEGVRLVDPQNPSLTGLGALSGLLQPIVFMFNAVVSLISAFANPTSVQAWMQAIMNTTPLGIGTAAATISAHYPKPIMLVPGEVVPIPLTPNIMPIQLLRIGSFALLGVPAEVTTVAGLRFRRVVAAALSRLEVTHIVVGAYANGYASYITTKEEYESQEYEGASTLFGPRTCAAFEKAFSSLAKALALNGAVADDAPQPDLRNDVMTKRRMTFRNLGAAPERFRLYQVGDSRYDLLLWGGADFLVGPGAERAVVVPFPSSIFLQNLQVVVGSDPLGPSQPPVRRVFARTSDLIVVDQGGMPVASPYFPPAR